MAKPIMIDDIMSSGAGSAISTKLLIENYIDRYNSKIIKEIKLHCLKDKENYICHVLIPSEKNNEYENPIFYNVIFEFRPLTKADQLSTSIREYAIRAFSNNPIFIYNFTYVYAKADGIPHFVPKPYYNEQALKENPKTTNPYHLFGIDRSLFTALYHIQLVTGFRKNRLDLLMLDKIKPIDLLRDIMGQQEKLEEIAIEEKKVRLKKQNTKGRKTVKIKEKGSVKNKQNKQRALLAKLNNSKALQKIEKQIQDDAKNNIATSGLAKSFKSSLGGKK